LGLCVGGCLLCLLFPQVCFWGCFCFVFFFLCTRHVVTLSSCQMSTGFLSLQVWFPVFPVRSLLFPRDVIFCPEAHLPFFFFPFCFWDFLKKSAAPKMRAVFSSRTRRSWLFLLINVLLAYPPCGVPRISCRLFLTSELL